MKMITNKWYQVILLSGAFLLVSGCDDDKKNNDNAIRDADGNEYTSVVIGEQEWLVENLRTTKYRDGSPIDYPGTDTIAWQTNTTGAYAWYNSDEASKATYGALYNWYAVANEKQLCPEGYRVSTSSDWAQMLTYLANTHAITNLADDTLGIANKIKSCRMMNSPLGGECSVAIHPRWDYHASHVATNDYGFSALPGGDRTSGNFTSLGKFGFWWCLNDINADNANRIYINYNRGRVYASTTAKLMGHSVRCLKE